MIITIENLLPKTAPITYSAAPLISGNVQFYAKSFNQFLPSWALQFGETGEAQSEIVLLGTSTLSGGDSGTLAIAMQFAHPTDTPIYGIKYDQVVFERSTGGTTGTATPLANGTITIMANGTVTSFDDTSGSTSYAYRTYYRNSALNVTSVESDWITFAGYPMYSLASIRERIKEKLFNSNYIAVDETINNWINEWLETMTNAAIELNKDYLLGSTQVSFSGTTDLGTITATDFKQARRIWMTNGNAPQMEASVVSINDFDPNTTFDASMPIVYFYGDNILGRKPNNETGTASMIYYKTVPVLVDDTDQLPVSMQSYSKSFVDYGLAQAKRKDNLPTEADALEASAVGQLNRFKMDQTPRAQTGPVFARMDEAMSADSDYWW